VPPVLFAIDTAATLLGIAACVSAVGGCIASIMAVRKARDEEQQACIERLRDTRAEAEKAAAELHALKMRHPDEGQ
jgi:hypothetical protein